jgi:hypothetical protein
LRIDKTFWKIPFFETKKFRICLTTKMEFCLPRCKKWSLTFHSPEDFKVDSTCQVCEWRYQNLWRHNNCDVIGPHQKEMWKIRKISKKKK